MPGASSHGGSECARCSDRAIALDPAPFFHSPSFVDFLRCPPIRPEDTPGTCQLSAQCQFPSCRTNHATLPPSRPRVARSPHWRAARLLELAAPPMRPQQRDCAVAAACRRSGLPSRRPWCRCLPSRRPCPLEWGRRARRAARGLSRPADRRGGDCCSLAPCLPGWWGAAGVPRAGGAILCPSPCVARAGLCGQGPDLSRMTASWQSGNREC